MSVTREKLYDEIWTDPITKVSKRYGVSDSYLVRILKSLNIPRPPRGYWAMVAAGIHSEKPPLPAAQAGDAITWSRDGDVEYAPSTPSKDEIANNRTRSSSNRSLTHGLVREAREHFKNVRDSRNSYLKPYKKLTIDLIISQDTLERGLSITSDLFLSLGALGHRVRIAPNDYNIHRAAVDERDNTKPQRHYSDLWSPYRPTVVYIQDVMIGLTIFEISEEIEVGYLKGEYIPMTEYLKHPLIKSQSVVTWTTKHSIPSGRLCIQAYSTHPGTHWVKQWKESKPGEFSKTLKSIVSELCNTRDEVAEATKIAIQEAEERQRKWEIEREKSRREAEERVRVKNIKDSKEELLGIIETWAETKRINEFFKDVLSCSSDLSDHERHLIESKLTEAKKLLGSLDTLKCLDEWRSPEEREFKHSG